jgi:hypothetical protein
MKRYLQYLGIPDEVRCGVDDDLDKFRVIARGIRCDGKLDGSRR